MRELISTLKQFDGDYGYSVTSSLAERASYMRQAAQEAHEAFEYASATPERTAAQDASLITVMGLKHSAAIFRESAAAYDKASEAWEALMTDLETALDDE